MSFICQLEACSLPPKARELTMLQKGLVQVFICPDCDGDETKSGMFKVPEDKMVPSLWSLAAQTLVGSGRDLSECLPPTLEKRVRDHTEAYLGEALEESEIEGWNELCSEVPLCIEMVHSANEDAVEWISLEPREMIKQEHRNGVGKVDIPWTGPDNIKLGGWINWCLDPVYPECPDCNTRKTAPLLELGESDKVLCFWDGGMAHVTLCPKCQQPGFGWEA